MKKAAFTLLAALSFFASGCTGIAAAATIKAATAPAEAAAPGQTSPTSPAATPTAGELTPFPVTPTAERNQLSTSYAGAASLVVQMAAGTLELEGTDQAVTKDQAIALLPLWEDYLQLTEKAPAAPTTVAAAASRPDEITVQIELMMTPTQLKAISDLRITGQSAGDALNAAGTTPQAPETITSTDPAQLISVVIRYLKMTAAL